MPSPPACPRLLHLNPESIPSSLRLGLASQNKSAEFQPDPKTIKATVGNFPEMYAAAPRYVEMRCLLNLSDFDFARFLQGNTLVAIDQQIVHPHEAWNGLR
jgi:hypothetical protein